MERRGKNTAVLASKFQPLLNPNRGAHTSTTNVVCGALEESKDETVTDLQDEQEADSLRNSSG